MGGRKGTRAVKKTERWGAGMVICLEQGADLHMAQWMPLPLTVSCFSKIQIGFTFLVPAHPGSPGKRAIKWVCVCVCAYVSIFYRFRDTAGYLSKDADFDPPHLILIFDRPHLHLAPSYGVTQVEFCGDLWQQKTRVTGLTCGFVCVILRLAVLVELQLVTDTDGHRPMASTADA